MYGDLLFSRVVIKESVSIKSVSVRSMDLGIMSLTKKNVWYGIWYGVWYMVYLWYNSMVYDCSKTMVYHIV